jgi:hypothetical protein
LGSTQPLTHMSTRAISWVVKAAGALDWQPYRLHVSIVMKSTSWNPQGLYRDCFTFTSVPLCVCSLQLIADLFLYHSWSSVHFIRRWYSTRRWRGISHFSVTFISHNVSRYMVGPNNNHLIDGNRFSWTGTPVNQRERSRRLTSYTKIESVYLPGFQSCGGSFIL